MPKKITESSDSAFKNWINADVMKRTAMHVHEHAPEFDSKRFLTVAKELPALELKARVQLISQALRDFLPQDYPKALKILLLAVEKPRQGTTALIGFALWPITHFIQTYGLEYPKESMQALHTLTQKFTAEFAVRPFIAQDPEKVLKLILKWAADKNHHVRRLASEGTRPRLPWGEQLKFLIKDPSPTLLILDKLKYDDELYVRKSVANHLNDISKDHPDLVVKIAQRWLKDAPAKHLGKIQWIVRHCLRTLLKEGHPEALSLLGFHPPKKVKISRLRLSRKRVSLGESLEISFDLESVSAEKLMIDYIIHHKKANGKHSTKVFKLTTKTVQAKQIYTFKKKHSFKKVTTRTYFSGKHLLEIMINGKVLSRTDFKLIVELV